MNLIDIVLLVLLGAYMFWVLKKYVFTKGDDCTGLCGSCHASKCSIEDLQKDLDDYRRHA